MNTRGQHLLSEDVYHGEATDNEATATNTSYYIEKCFQRYSEIHRFIDIAKASEDQKLPQTECHA